MESGIAFLLAAMAIAVLAMLALAIAGRNTKDGGWVVGFAAWDEESYNDRGRRWFTIARWLIFAAIALWCLFAFTLIGSGAA